MRKTYIKPTSELIVMNPVQLLAGSLNANDQSDPSLGRELDLDFGIGFDEEKILLGESPFIGL
ncbi:MAG: hypothetical protein IJ190_04795 [Prevotella sp.]|nr:hypothetical protein [Prevotella sp.]